MKSTRGNKRGLFCRVKGVDCECPCCGGHKSDFKVQAKIALRRSDRLAIQEQEVDMDNKKTFDRIAFEKTVIDGVVSYCISEKKQNGVVSNVIYLSKIDIESLFSAFALECRGYMEGREMALKMHKEDLIDRINKILDEYEG